MLRDTEHWQDHMISIDSIIVYLHNSVGNKANLLPKVLALLTKQVQSTKIYTVTFLLIKGGGEEAGGLLVLTKIS